MDIVRFAETFIDGRDTLNNDPSDIRTGPIPPSSASNRGTSFQTDWMDWSRCLAIYCSYLDISRIVCQAKHFCVRGLQMFHGCIAPSVTIIDSCCILLSVLASDPQELYTIDPVKFASGFNAIGICKKLSDKKESSQRVQSLSEAHRSCLACRQALSFRPPAIVSKSWCSEQLSAIARCRLTARAWGKWQHATAVVGENFQHCTLTTSLAQDW